jgi:hypothetical protein
MSLKPTFKIDSREFNKTLAAYTKSGKKILADVINQKAFFIARGATRLTPRADYKKFAAQLGIATRPVDKGKRIGRPTIN